MVGGSGFVNFGQGKSRAKLLMGVAAILWAKETFGRILCNHACGLSYAGSVGTY